MIIGEKMSQVVTDVESMVFSGNEIYEDQVHFLSLRPLDTGRLLYTKLRVGIDNRVPVEVYWDHFNSLLTVVVGPESHDYQVTFKEWQMARSDMIERIDALVQEVKEAEPFLLALS